MRVDVYQDERGHIQAYTRERLSTGWGDERNEVASLLVRTGLDVLEEFREDQLTGEQDDSDEDVEPGPTDPRNPRPPRWLNPDLARLYR